MNPKKKFVIAIAVMLGASVAFAQGHCGGGMHFGHGPGIPEKIPDLSEKQQEEIIKIRRQVRKDMRTFRPDMVKLHAQLRGLIEEGASKAEVDAKIDEIAHKKAAIMKTHAGALIKASQLLNDKQKEFLWSRRPGFGKFHHKAKPGSDCRNKSRRKR